MKKIMMTMLLAASLYAAPAARAETVKCSTSQYGGAVCGIETKTETTVTHKTVEAGLADYPAIQLALYAGISAVVATLLYKASYRLYFLD